MQLIYNNQATVSAATAVAASNPMTAGQLIVVPLTIAANGSTLIGLLQDSLTAPDESVRAWFSYAAGGMEISPLSVATILAAPPTYRTASVTPAYWPVSRAVNYIMVYATVPNSPPVLTSQHGVAYLPMTAGTIYLNLLNLANEVNSFLMTQGTPLGP